jgi:hypothetical protein
MIGEANETVGEKFQSDRLQLARDKTLQVIQTAAARIVPGMTETNSSSNATFWRFL